MKQSPRVLLIAEAANPEWTSVPLIGWSLSQALARICNAHLVTHIRNREAIIRAGLVEGENFTAIDNEHIAVPVLKLASMLRGGEGKGWTTLSAFSSLSYYSFESEIWRLFEQRFASGEFDLVHRITPLSPTHQSLIARKLAKLGIPFVIGPLNGGVPWPKSFIDRQHAEHEWLSHIRSAYKFMPGYKSTLRYSTAIMAGSKFTLQALPEWVQQKSSYIPENAVDPARFNAPLARIAALPLRGAFIGRLVPYKGADILLEAVTDYLSDGRLTLDFLGDGPQREELERLAVSLGIEDKIVFHGWIPHTQVQSILTNCDFLALPSVREFGGGVVIEAMALGITPIVANYAGPSELVDDQTGIRVDFDNKESLIAGFRQAIGEAIEKPEILDKMGVEGRKKALRDFTWDAKAQQILKIYDAAMTEIRPAA